MRTIKFRGWSKKCNEWVIGNLIVGLEHDYYILVYSKTGFIKYIVQPETIGQFTGLIDKNGKEIYEGDIVLSQFYKKPFGVVTWHTDGYFFIDYYFGEWQYYGKDFVSLGEIMKRKIGGKSHQFEVIGNIHDNPQLINK